MAIEDDDLIIEDVETTNVSGFFVLGNRSVLQRFGEFYMVNPTFPSPTPPLATVSAAIG